MKSVQNPTNSHPVHLDQNKSSNDEIQPNEVISLVAHELKTPMASIRGYTELLLSGSAGEINPTQSKFLNTILSNILRMTELVTDLNDTARIDSGREQLNITSIEPVALINEVVEGIIPQIVDKNLQLDSDLPDNLPKIDADRLRFIQVWNNLLSNAAKYTLPGGKITISGRVIKDHLQFAILDNGIGIKEEDQKNIFHRYYRTNDAHLRDIPGTGLGLYISKRLIELQGGDIWFESEYGKGTTFYFTMNISK